MIHLRFIHLALAASSILGVHTFSISNRTSPRSVPSAALDAARNSTTPTSISPHKPRAASIRHATRNVHENQQVYPRDSSPTPAPTGPSQESTTVHITDASNFAILLPKQGSHSSIADSESDAQSYCIGSGCNGLPTLAQGFIAAADVQSGGSGNGRWIQVTGCINPSAMSLNTDDRGGQYDVRFPNGAQCTFGGYGKSFIEQVEPASRRFCLRCCSSENDQTNCNSHNDEAGCVTTIPGKYDFPEDGVSCA